MSKGTWINAGRNFIAGILVSLLSSAAMWLSSCSPGTGSMEPLAASEAPARQATNQKPAEERPGLATKFGKEIRDEWQQQSFVRASTGPSGTDMVYYNDKEGLEAMVSYKYQTEALQQAAAGMVEWGIKSGPRYLPVYRSSQGRFVQGKAGTSYTLYVRNRCKSRVEVVLSVDGLDVIDGRAASFRKRGYVIAPGSSLEVKGWRTGLDRVARFEFSSVGSSYANQRHGDARNVGVIGLAVFGEKGVDPWKWMPTEVNVRKTATPFSSAP